MLNKYGYFISTFDNISFKAGRYPHCNGAHITERETSYPVPQPDLLHLETELEYLSIYPPTASI